MQFYCPRATRLSPYVCGLPSQEYTPNGGFSSTQLSLLRSHSCAHSAVRGGFFAPFLQNCRLTKLVFTACSHTTSPDPIQLSSFCYIGKSPDLAKNLLICNVKKDNWEQYLDGSAKIYYTGKKFPTTVALNKLYYFMPYLSGKGIRDLYYIKIARLGYRREGQENEDKNDLRLVFEIERVGQLFDDYKKVKLEIWRTFTDTTMEKILEQE